jgi:hypothetical protein
MRYYCGAQLAMRRGTVLLFAAAAAALTAAPAAAAGGGLCRFFLHKSSCEGKSTDACLCRWDLGADACVLDAPLPTGVVAPACVRMDGDPPPWLTKGPSSSSGSVSLRANALEADICAGALAGEPGERRQEQEAAVWGVGGGAYRRALDERQIHRSLITPF